MPVRLREHCSARSIRLAIRVIRRSNRRWIPSYRAIHRSNHHWIPNCHAIHRSNRRWIPSYHAIRTIRHWSASERVGDANVGTIRRKNPTNRPRIPTSRPKNHRKIRPRNPTNRLRNRRNFHATTTLERRTR